MKIYRVIATGTISYLIMTNEMLTNGILISSDSYFNSQLYHDVINSSEIDYWVKSKELV